MAVTVIFVSHSMPAVRSLCKNAILLKNGVISTQGPTDMVITKYMASDTGDYLSHKIYTPPLKLNNNVTVYSFSVNKPGQQAGESITIDSPIEIKIDMQVNDTDISNRYDISFQVKNDEGIIQFISRTGELDESIITKGRQSITCRIPANFFNTGTIYFNFILVENRRTILLKEDDIVKLILIDPEISMGKIGRRPSGVFKT